MNISDLTGATEKRDGAYEIKFVIANPIAEAALAWARKHLLPDPHAEPSHGDGYQVNSLYFDTPQMDVYQRNGSYGKAKYRVRRYGLEPCLFLERKLKSRGLVSKRRTRIPDEDILYLATAEGGPAWLGYWFRRRLLARQLLPQCQIQYQRVARVGATPEGSVRLTLDRDVCAFPSNEFAVSESGPWMPLLAGQCILELKFHTNLPLLFKSLIDELALNPQPVSKYRLTIQAAGLEPQSQPKPAERNGHVVPGAIPQDNRIVAFNPSSVAGDA